MITPPPLVKPTYPRSAGFSIPELMVVIGILTVLAGVLLPGLSRSRQTARDLGLLSNIRQVGLVVSVYMDEHRGAPAAFPARPAPAEPGHHELRTPYGRITGYWFTNSKLFQYVLDERLPDAVISAPGRPKDDSGVYRLGSFSISDTFYARPDYWDRRTQRGPAQWVAMRLDQVRFPSSKGFMLQDMTYALPSFPDGMMTCCARDVSSAILWSDLSASEEIQGLMPPGAPNFYHEGNSGTTSYWDDGAPVRSTVNGVHGRDR
jgi:prepilin-type N-terminal cleavage/methylation domain-containing protein